MNTISGSTDATMRLQTEKCAAYGASPLACGSQLKVGISENVKHGILPINALRVTPTGDTCGWYVWAGDWSDAEDFFKPLHVEHLEEWCPSIIPYLQLPPGWRVQLAPNHEDVWFDHELKV
jgi:hypothetical protein